MLKHKTHVAVIVSLGSKLILAKAHRLVLSAASNFLASICQREEVNIILPEAVKVDELRTFLR